MGGEGKKKGRKEGRKEERKKEGIALVENGKPSDA